MHEQVRAGVGIVSGRRSVAEVSFHYLLGHKRSDRCVTDGVAADAILVPCLESTVVQELRNPQVMLALRIQHPACTRYHAR